jgi:hypothetical protein
MALRFGNVISSRALRGNGRTSMIETFVVIIAMMVALLVALGAAVGVAGLAKGKGFVELRTRPEP